jgi:hypothetical protein
VRRVCVKERDHNITTLPDWDGIGTLLSAGVNGVGRCQRRWKMTPVVILISLYIDYKISSVMRDRCKVSL